MTTLVTWLEREAEKEEEKANFGRWFSPVCCGGMYEAFELQKLVEKLPLKICALATWGERNSIVSP